MSAEGMKKGETRFGPFSLMSTAVSAMAERPPMPEPIITPVRQRSSSDCGSQPESFTACVAAAMA